MHAFSHKLNQPQQPTSSSRARSSTTALLGYAHNTLADERARAEDQLSPSKLETPEDVRGSVAARLNHAFSAIRVYPQRSVMLQTKLMVNAPGDAYEHEAERVAEKIVDLPISASRHACSCGGDCPDCQAKQQSQTRKPLDIQRVQTHNVGQIAAPPIVDQVLRSSGRPLDSASRGFFEPRFGHDFSQVRIHTDAQAAASAHSIHARAYTAGRAIVFGPGQYQPETQDGRHLLAHELTHVVQQGASESHSAVSPARIQRNEVRFTGCAANGHDLAHFRVIPDDQDEPMYAPKDGVEHEDTDGFLWRHERNHWYKIPFGCDAEVFCDVDEEGNRQIDPEGDCNFIGEYRGSTRWETMDSVPLNARPFPWPD